MNKEATSDAFLARLWELQEATGWSNVKLADRLGVTAGYISRLKAGERSGNISIGIALRAVSEFPELHRLLSSDMTVSNTVVPAIKGKGAPR